MQKIITIIIGLVIVAYTGYTLIAFNVRLKNIEGQLVPLDVLGLEIISTSKGGPTASSTDFLSAVYNANLQINQILTKQ